MVLKINAFYYITTGGILSCFFSKVSADSHVTPHIIKHVLWFPTLKSTMKILQNSGLTAIH